MKKLLVIVLVVFGIMGAGVVVVFQLTAGIVDTTDHFFTAVRTGDLDQAAAFLSAEFKASTSQAELETFLAHSSLLRYRSATWDSRSIENDKGYLEGTIETDGGGKVPVTVTLVKEAGTWRIHSIAKETAGLVSQGGETELPREEELRNLATATLLDLAHAINSQNFEDFYHKVAKLWQAQTNVGELHEAFRSFMDQHIDLTGLHGLEPVFSMEPQLGEDGVLRLEGYFPSQTSVTIFGLGYVYEHPQWKLLEISIELG